MCVAFALTLAPQALDAQPLVSRTEVDADDPLDGPQRGEVWRWAVEDEAPGGLEASMGQAPSLQVQQTGAEGQPTFLSVRGAPAAHTRFTLDGLPLDGAFGGAFDLATLPLALIGEVRVHRSFVPLALGPVTPGGVVALETASIDEGSFDALLSGGSFGHRRASLSGSWRREGAGSADRAHRLVIAYRGAANRFRYFETGGTNTPEDDSTSRPRTADVNDGFLLHRATARAGAWRVDTLAIGGVRERGVPGLSSAPLLDTRSSSLRADVGVRLRREASRLTHDVLFAASLVENTLRDPRGELTRVPGTRTRDRAARALLAARPSLLLTDRPEARLRAQLLAEAAAEPWRALGDTTTGVSGADRVRMATGAEVALSFARERVHLGASVRADHLRTRERGAAQRALVPHATLLSTQLGLGVVAVRSARHDLTLSATLAPAQRAPD